LEFPIFSPSQPPLRAAAFFSLSAFHVLRGCHGDLSAFLNPFFSARRQYCCSQCCPLLPLNSTAAGNFCARFPLSLSSLKQNPRSLFPTPFFPPPLFCPLSTQYARVPFPKAPPHFLGLLRHQPPLMPLSSCLSVVFFA